MEKINQKKEIKKKELKKYNQIKRTIFIKAINFRY